MEEQVRERHPSLSAWLTLLAIANGFSAVIYLFMWVTLLVVKASGNSDVPIGTTLPYLTVTSLAALIFIFGVYKWKKWGVYGFAATTLITFSIYMKMDMNNLMAIFGLIGISVLVYLIRPYWQQLDNL